MSLPNVLIEVRGRLEGIPGLRVYEYPPDAVNELPACVVSKVEGDFQQAFAATEVLWTLQVTILVRQWDTPDAMEEMALYLTPSGLKSVRAALDGALTSGVGYLTVVRVKDVGRRQLFGGVYAAADFIVEARESGA